MFKHTILLQAFLIAALCAIGHTHAGTVVGADIGASSEAEKTILANRHLGGKGKGKGKGKGGSKGKGKGKGKGKVSKLK